MVVFPNGIANQKCDFAFPASTGFAGDVEVILSW